MTDFNITHRDEVEWIIAHDPRARFSVGNYDRTDGGLTVRTLKAIPRNADRIMDNDVISAHVSPAVAQGFRTFQVALMRSIGAVPPAPVTPPPASATPAPRPARDEPTLLPKMPLPPHVRRKEPS